MLFAKKVLFLLWAYKEFLSNIVMNAMLKMFSIHTFKHEITSTANKIGRYRDESSQVYFWCFFDNCISIYIFNPGLTFLNSGCLVTILLGIWEICLIIKL